jgi:beta-aspartyl-dipeptidase (metallo-type)
MLAVIPVCWVTPASFRSSEEIMHFTLIEHGEVYAPQPIGPQSLLLLGEQIVKIGSLDAAGLIALGLECETVDARGCFVLPGLVDPHAHLIGAGGEEGFASRMPEVLPSQLALAGVTTVVGLLGTDTMTRQLSSLHAKVNQLWEEGFTAYMYTGGFELPPSTLTGSIIDDIVLIDKIIGTGEVAISDPRWIDPQLDPLAHLVVQTRTGGKMSGRAGVTHFHTGDGKRRLGLLHELLDHYDIPADALYPTHINRTQALLDDGISLAKRGAFVDMDTIDEELGQQIHYYREHGGPMDRLTISSDAHTPAGSTRKLYDQFVASVRDEGLPLVQVLPLFTQNTATVLKLEGKGSLAAGKSADVLVVDRESFDLIHVFARGRHLVCNGELKVVSKQEQQVASGKE